MNNILVSVLMPCYNASQYFVEAVESILNQTHSNFELLLIDDGSSDNTREMIADYAQRDKRIVPVYNEQNMGLIKTLNKGVMMAKGEYIARMDSDDISALNRIEVLLAEITRNPDIKVISAGFYYISTKGKIIRRVYPKAISAKALKFVSFFSTPVNHPCSMMSTKLLQQNHFDEMYIHSEDYEIFSRFLIEGYKVVNLPQPLYYLRVNPQSVSFKFESIQISTHTKISARNLEQYFNINYDFFLHKVMINRISFNVNTSLLKLAFNSLDELKKEFLKKESLTSNEITQINEFLTEQKIDIILQSMKCANWVNRFSILTVMIKTMHEFLSPRGIQYLRTKLNLIK